MDRENSRRVLSPTLFFGVTCKLCLGRFRVAFGSFWGRSWVPLGGHFRSSWRLFPSKLVPDPSSNRVISEKAFCDEIQRFPFLFADFCPDMAARNDPRSLQDGTKIALDRCFCLFDFRFDF